MTQNAHGTREGWLLAAVKLLDKHFFAPKGYKLPGKIGVSCGFPRGHATAIGQCWHPLVAADGTTHIFICPTQDSTMRVLDILLHELIHAQVGLKCGHRGEFKDRAIEFGLSGRMTATFVEPDTILHSRLKALADELGPYPHAALGKRNIKDVPAGKGGGDGDGEGDGGEGEPKSKGWQWLYSTKTRKFKIPFRDKMLEEFGPPKDPWGEDMVPEADLPKPTSEKDDEDDEG